MRQKLEEEMIKNENLERKLRTIEFEQMTKANELNRKIQELELKNSNLLKQISDQEKHNHSSDIRADKESGYNSSS